MSRRLVLGTVSAIAVVLTATAIAVLAPEAAPQPGPAPAGDEQLAGTGQTGDNYLPAVIIIVATGVLVRIRRPRRFG